MPKVKFLHPRKLGKMRYPKGVCEVPTADCKGWFFDELQKAGDIVVVAEIVVPTHVGAKDGVEPSAKSAAPSPSDAKSVKSAEPTEPVEPAESGAPKSKSKAS